MKNKLLSIFILELMLIPFFVVAPVLENPYLLKVIKYDSEYPERWAVEIGLVKEDDLASRIVFCESSWEDWECNRQYGCIAGMGLFGIISGTWNKTIVEMSKNDIYMPERCWNFVYLPMSEKRTEVIFDGECNLRVGLYLLEKDGTKHWGIEDSSWGSRDCWNKYYVNNL